MNPREKINREFVNVIGCIKDNVSTDIIKAVREGKLSVTEKEMPKLISLVNQIVDAAYYRSNSTMMRAVDGALEDAVKQHVAKKA